VAARLFSGIQLLVMMVGEPSPVIAQKAAQ